MKGWRRIGKGRKEGAERDDMAQWGGREGLMMWQKWGLNELEGRLKMWEVMSGPGKEEGAG